MRVLIKILYFFTKWYEVFENGKDGNILHSSNGANDSNSSSRQYVTCWFNLKQIMKSRVPSCPCIYRFSWVAADLRWSMNLPDTILMILLLLNMDCMGVHILRARTCKRI
jgi:hypothetical protein